MLSVQNNYNLVILNNVIKELNPFNVITIFHLVPWSVS